MNYIYLIPFQDLHVENEHIFKRKMNVLFSRVYLTEYLELVTTVTMLESTRDIELSALCNLHKCARYRYRLEI